MEFFTEANDFINTLEYLTAKEKLELKTMVEMSEFKDWQECKDFICENAQSICEAAK
jgi:hypothetical protein